MASKTKTKSKSITKPSTAVAQRKTASPPATVLDAARMHAGKGISDRAEDNIVPLVYLLQVNSKPAMKGHERYIQGAEGGDIWLRNMPPEECIVKSEDGLVFQPCHLTVCWIEWLPDRGGFVARHAARPPEAKLEDVEGDNGQTRKMWIMPNGNIVGESREYAGFVYLEGHDPLPYVIPLSGSGHTVGRQWMTTMREERLPDGSRAPIFMNLWRLTPKLRTKNNNSWYMYEITKEGPVGTAEEVLRGAALHDAFASGAKQAAAEEAVDEVSETEI